MSTQIILHQLKLRSQKNSLRQISESTGIQLTRIFRIINGAPLKEHELHPLCEYLKFDFSFIPKESPEEIQEFKKLFENWHRTPPLLKKALLSYLREFHHLCELARIPIPADRLN